MRGDDDRKTGGRMDPLADAQAWYDRAQLHIREYGDLAYSEDDRIWQLRSRRGDDGRHVYAIVHDRTVLPRLKPIACEVANSLFQSLDNIIGAAARIADVERTPQIAWPWALEPDLDVKLPKAVKPAITGRLNQMRGRGMPDPWLDLIRQTFAAHAAGLVHIDVVKEVSLSGKHWGLVPTEANAVAVGWTPKGCNKQVIANIPRDHFDANDEFVFHEGDPIDALHFQTVIGTFLAAAGKDHQPEPMSAFGYTSRFVATALDNARGLLDGAPQAEIAAKGDPSVRAPSGT